MHCENARILMREVNKMSKKARKPACEIDDVENVASANECTGMLPCMPADEDTQPVRRMMHVHSEPEKR